MSKSDRLARILDSPRLDRLVPRLRPELLHQAILRRGLEDSTDLVAAATPEQIARVFDMDLWRSAPGQHERLDGDRFGVWLEVLMDAGAEVAAEKLLGLDTALIVAGLARHMRVFDRAAVERDGFEIGGYLVEPKRTESWDAISELLLHLEDRHHDYFTRLMAGCRRLSNAGFERDGLHDLAGDAEQDELDLAYAREERREKAGYVTPAQARAFLQLARERRHDQGPLERNPIAVAYFRGIGRTPGLARIGEDTQSTRALEELAFLANVLLVGCSLQGWAFTPDEASQAAAAVCKLGADTSPSPERDVIRSFEIGWRLLYQNVCMATANRVLDLLAELRIRDRDIRLGLNQLRLELGHATRAGEPWRARDALDIVMTLDMPAWATLLGFIAECPVMSAAMHANGAHRVSPTEFEFISEPAHLKAIETTIWLLGSRLRAD